MNDPKFNNVMRFLVWIQGIIGIFFMYKCLSYPGINIWLCLIAGIIIVCVLLISSMLLTNGLNDFYYDIGELDISIKRLTNEMKTRKEP